MLEPIIVGDSRSKCLSAAQIQSSIAQGRGLTQYSDHDCRILSLRCEEASKQCPNPHGIQVKFGFRNDAFFEYIFTSYPSPCDASKRSASGLQANTLQRGTDQIARAYAGMRPTLWTLLGKTSLNSPFASAVSSVVAPSLSRVKVKLDAGTLFVEQP